MDMKLELVILPVADVDRAKAFYADAAGFHVDVDTSPVPGMRVVQLTPPGSACSIGIGTGLGFDASPGSVRGIHLVVTDIEASVAELRERGLDVRDLHHYVGGEQRPGADPDHADYHSFASFADPDGNTWVLQEKGYGA